MNSYQNEDNSKKNLYIISNLNDSINNENDIIINNINNNIFIYGLSKSSFEYIVNPRENIKTENKKIQTEYSQLYIKENNKKRKNDTDLIRNKIFIQFNKVIYNWLLNSKSEKDKIKIIQYHPKKLNKNIINILMSKKIKELFIQKDSSSIIINESLKKKLEFYYKDLYDYFISEKEYINENNEILNDFPNLNNYLESLKGNEEENYINKLKTIALGFNKWKDKKVHLFKKK